MVESKTLMDKAPKYTDKLADEICDHIINGLSLRQIAKIKGMPKPSLLLKWVGKHEYFCEQYTRAKEEQAELLADEIISIADDIGLDTQHARLRVDARKWVASKLKAKKYGDVSRNENLNINTTPQELDDHDKEILKKYGIFPDKS